MWLEYISPLINMFYISEMFKFCIDILLYYGIWYDIMAYNRLQKKSIMVICIMVKKNKWTFIIRKIIKTLVTFYNKVSVDS